MRKKKVLTSPKGAPVLIGGSRLMRLHESVWLVLMLLALPVLGWCSSFEPTQDEIALSLQDLKPRIESQFEAARRSQSFLGISIHKRG